MPQIVYGPVHVERELLGVRHRRSWQHLPCPNRVRGHLRFDFHHPCLPWIHRRTSPPRLDQLPGAFRADSLGRGRGALLRPGLGNGVAPGGKVAEIVARSASSDAAGSEFAGISERVHGPPSSRIGGDAWSIFLSCRNTPRDVLGAHGGTPCRHPPVQEGSGSAEQARRLAPIAVVPVVFFPNPV